MIKWFSDTSGILESPIVGTTEITMRSDGDVQIDRDVNRIHITIDEMREIVEKFDKQNKISVL